MAVVGTGSERVHHCTETGLCGEVAGGMSRPGVQVYTAGGEGRPTPPRFPETTISHLQIRGEATLPQTGGILRAIL